MTFIEESSERPSIGEYIAFATIAAMFLVCFFILLLHKTRHHAATVGTPNPLKQIHFIKIGFPIVCLILCIENVLLCFENELDDTMTGVKVFYCFHAGVIPVILIISFEVCYMVHKRRSVNFCHIYFDEGRRVKTHCKSFLLRNAIYILALFLFCINLVSSFRKDEDIMAGKVGWIQFFNDERLLKNKTHVLISLVSALILFVCELYLSIRIWMYGARSSLVIYPSYFNPWIKMFVGTLCLMGGELFTQKYFPITSNAGILLLVVSIISTMDEVHKELAAEIHLEGFLDAVQNKASTTVLSNNTAAA